MSKIAWKTIPGWENYQASSDGKIRSVTRNLIVCRLGSTFNRTVWGKLLSPQQTKTGYWQVLLSGNGDKKLQLVHRLVLLAFVGPCPDGMVACHNDGNQSNNYLKNLRWDTRKANEADKVKHGRKENRTGTNNPKSKLTKEQVDSIRHEYSWGNTSYTKLGKKYNVSKGCIGSIVRGENWESTETESITTVQLKK